MKSPTFKQFPRQKRRIKTLNKCLLPILTNNDNFQVRITSVYYLFRPTMIMFRSEQCIERAVAVYHQLFLFHQVLLLLIFHFSANFPLFSFSFTKLSNFIAFFFIHVLQYLPRPAIFFNFSTLLFLPPFYSFVFSLIVYHPSSLLCICRETIFINSSLVR